jgi:uncharacterized integral membrane protein (TIGR00697 family)
MRSKRQKLFLVLGGFFIINAIVAEFIGVKIFSLEATMGWQQFKIPLFGSVFSFDLTAGVLLWPVVFIMTDVINEHFGVKGVKFLSWLAAALIIYAFFMVFIAISLVPASWWSSSQTQNGVVDMQLAFKSIFGQGLWIIVGSLISFLVGQILDAIIFQKIKQIYSHKMLWLRATVSTLFSQLIDSYLVLFIAFYIGNNWSFQRVMSIGTGNYIYKFSIAILMIPILYLVHYLINNYLKNDEEELVKPS